MEEKKNLFHYCSSATFYSIISNKNIWLSSLSLSNDSQEGRLVKSMIGDLLQEESISEAAKNEVIDNLNFIEDEVDGFALCLSEDGDILSQWRGYADDGHGFSIGFSKSYIEDLTSIHSDFFEYSLGKILYSKEDHIKSIKPYYELMKSHFNDLTPQGLRDTKFNPATAKSKIFSTTLELISKLYLVKNTGFSEEKEWRILAIALKSELGNNREIKFRANKDKIIPYIELPTPKKNENPINKIFIGPKNKTPDYVINSFLKIAGLENVEVCRSSTSYR